MLGQKRRSDGVDGKGAQKPGCVEVRQALFGAVAVDRQGTRGVDHEGKPPLPRQCGGGGGDRGFVFQVDAWRRCAAEADDAAALGLGL